MQRHFVWLVALFAALLTYGVWHLWRSDPRRSDPADDGLPQRAPRERNESPQTSRAVMHQLMDEWLGNHLSNVDRYAPFRQRGDPALNVVAPVSELLALCKGKDPNACNTPEVKERIKELSLNSWTAEEIAAMVQLFRTSDEPGFKYHMMVAFRFMGSEPMVDAVKEYYEVDPVMVSECLQWLAERTPRALDAFADLLQKEVHPQRRENLIQRAAFRSGANAEKFLMDVLDAGRDSADEKVALQALGRISTESARARLEAVLSGDERPAVYDLMAGPPVSEHLRDVRAHVVAGLLAGGDPAAVRDLFQRYTVANSDDKVATYIESFLSIAPTRVVLPDVVNHVLNRGQLNDGLLEYLETRAETADGGEIGRLFTLSTLSDDYRRRIENLLVKIR